MPGLSHLDTASVGIDADIQVDAIEVGLGSDQAFPDVSNGSNMPSVGMPF